MLPLHTLIKISFEEYSLGLVLVENAWLKETIQKKRIAIRHEVRDG